MAKEKRPKDDLQTAAKSRMAQMPAETAGGRLDQSLPPGSARPDRSDRPDAAPRRDPSSPQHNQQNQPRNGQPHETNGSQASTQDLPPKPMSRSDKQRNQPRR